MSFLSFMSSLDLLPGYDREKWPSTDVTFPPWPSPSPQQDSNKILLHDLLSTWFLFRELNKHGSWVKDVRLLYRMEMYFIYTNLFGSLILFLSSSICVWKREVETETEACPQTSQNGKAGPAFTCRSTRESRPSTLPGQHSRAGVELCSSCVHFEALYQLSYLPSDHALCPILALP